MRALALVVPLWLAASTPPAGPPARDEPAIGRFLVANRQVAGFFGESVIVLVDHGAHGTLGLIVNRPVELTLAELLPDLEEARGRKEHAYLGGPVGPGQLLLLIRSRTPPEGSAPVLEDLHVSGSPSTLKALLAGPRKGVEFRAYMGYSGWAPGQLASELARGDWTLAPGDTESVFARDPSGLWQKLLRRHQEIRVKAPLRIGKEPQIQRSGERSASRSASLHAFDFARLTRGKASRGLAARDGTWSARSTRSALAGAAESINLSRPWRSAAASSGFRTSGRARSSTR